MKHVPAEFSTGSTSGRLGMRLHLIFHRAGFASLIGGLILGFLGEVRASTEFTSRLWQMEDGLPHNIVQAIAQSSDGYLWVGTREGLARFDGVRFQPIDLESHARHPSILSLFESRDQSLWIGTEDLGLFCFRDGALHHWPAPGGARDFSVFEIHQGGDGVLWLATSVGILKFAGDKLEAGCSLQKSRGSALH